MKKLRNLKLLGLAGILFIAFIFAGINIIQAQVKTQGKGKPPKPPKTNCNNNGICEDGEYNTSRPYEDQTCPDCAPKDYDHLDTISMPFFLGLNAYSWSRIFQFKYINGKYVDTWASQDLGGWIEYDYGDYDSDGSTDILAVKLTSYTEGHGKKKTTYYEQTLFVFEHGSDGSPSYERYFFGPSTKWWRNFKLADANNDGFENELIFSNGDTLKIFHLDGTQFVNIWTSRPYGDTIYRFDVGDADGDGQNEIVCGMFKGGYALVIDYLENDLWGDEISTEVITVYNPDFHSIAIDQAIPCDADNDGLSKEIIAGGNNNRLMVWALVNGEYKTVAISDDLGGFTQGIGYGDFNGDGENEIVVGTHTSTLYVFKLLCTNSDPINPQYTLQMLQSSTTDLFSFSHIRTGDVDYDDKIEALEGGVIFDDRGFGLQPVFKCYYLSNPRIK